MVVDYVIIEFDDGHYIKWDTMGTKWYSTRFASPAIAQAKAQAQIVKWENYFYNQMIKQRGIRSEH